MIEKRKAFDREGMVYICNLSVSLILFAGLFFFLRSGFLNRAVMLLFGPNSLTILGKRVVSREAFLMVCIYGRDFLGGYVLFAMIAFLFSRSVEDLLRALKIALVFEAGVEIFLYLINPEISFELKNVFAQMIGSMVSFILLILFERRMI